MSLTLDMASQQYRQPSPMGGPTPTSAEAKSPFSSNNPFRRATSPIKSSAMATPAPTAEAKTPSATSNPFLDPSSPPSQTPPRQPGASLAKQLVGLSIARPSDSTINPVSSPSRKRIETSPSKGVIGVRPAPPSDTGLLIPVTDDARPPAASVRGKEEVPRSESRSRTKEGSRSKRSGRKTDRRDLIDKLDLSMPGFEIGVHHDGPYDSCNIIKKKGKYNPVDAFAPGSGNMSLKGGGPDRATEKEQFDVLHMVSEEAQSDFASSGKRLVPISATDRGQQLHGSLTDGLGTSTFLDGAPAPRNAVQRGGSFSDGMDKLTGPPALGRTKSFMKSMSRGRAYSQPRVQQAEPSPSVTYRAYPPGSTAQSAGGMLTINRQEENRDPFDVMNQQPSDKFRAPQGVSIDPAYANSATRPGISPVPVSSMPMGAPLTRRDTEGARPRTATDNEPKTGGFFSLGRYKSVKGRKQDVA